MNILAIDTTTNMCTVAIAKGDQQYIISEATPSRHAEVLLDFITQLLTQAELRKNDIDLIATTIGPGSFIGVRTSISVAQTIAYSLGIPVAALPTLQVIAQSAYNIEPECTKVICMLDARMEAIYWGEYELHNNRIMQAIHEDNLHKISELPEIDTNESCIAGNAFNNYPELITRYTANTIDCLYPEAEAMLQLAKYYYENELIVTPKEIVPLYIRNDVAHKAKK